MSRNDLVDGLEVILKKRDGCDSCHLGKQTISSHPTRGRREFYPVNAFIQMCVILELHRGTSVSTF